MQVEKEAYEFMSTFNEMSKEEPFTKSDVKSALECFDERYITFPIEDISKLSGIQIQKNKRNGRKQRLHLKLARANRDILCEERGKTDWRDGNGRPKGSGTKQLIIEQWQENHPRGTKADCIRETKLSKPTVYRWWR